MLVCVLERAHRWELEGGDASLLTSVTARLLRSRDLALLSPKGNTHTQNSARRRSNGTRNDACPPFSDTAAPPSPLNEYSAPQSFQTPNQVMGENGLARRFGFGLVLHVLFLWVRLQMVYAQGKTTTDRWPELEIWSVPENLRPQSRSYALRVI